MKILVTGANGYIGRHVVNRLQAQGHIILAIDHSPSNELAEYANVRYIQKSIFNFSSSCYKELGEIDVCIHLAWKEGFIHNSEAHIEQIQQHFFFLKGLIDYGISQLVVMGTMHEVGYWEGAIEENSPCNPASYYGIAKNTLRQLLISYLRDRDEILQWVRAFYVVGDDRHSQSIFSKLLKLEDEGKTILPFTSGKNLYDFISVDELANQIAHVALQQEITGIINCCSGVPVSLKDEVTNFIKKHNLSIQLDYGKYSERSYDSPGVWGSATKIKAILSNCGRL